MYKILVINDDISSLQTIVNYVEESSSNYIVFQALNGLTGLKIAREKKPDLIIVDWDMPGMNGIAFIIELKKEEETSDIPVIMATAVMTNVEHLNIALKAGAVDYIRIPLDKTELTARVYSMLELSKSYQQIKALNATKDKFFSIIAHDLRNPFNSLITLSSGLLEGYLSFDEDKQKKYFKIINESARNGYKLLENLLQWSRTQTGTIKFEPELIYVKALIEETLELIGPTAFEKNIMIELDSQENLVINGDKDMLSSVLRNLLSNAIKFTHPGGLVKISVSEVQFERTNQDILHAVEFRISDNGVGIPADKIDSLFRIDVNYSTRGTNKESGSGLGLILCKEFITRHGGDLNVKSEMGKGSTISFFIPKTAEQEESTAN